MYNNHCVVRLGKPPYLIRRLWVRICGGDLLPSIDQASRSIPWISNCVTEPCKFFRKKKKLPQCQFDNCWIKYCHFYFPLNYKLILSSILF